MSTTNTIKTFGKSTNATDSATLANETVNPIQVDQVLFDEVKSFLSTKNFNFLLFKLIYILPIRD